MWIYMIIFHCIQIWKAQKSLAYVTYVYNPNDGEAEHEDPWDLLCSQSYGIHMFQVLCETLSEKAQWRTINTFRTSL